MAISTVRQVIIQCDKCGQNISVDFVTQKQAIKNARSWGWSVGKEVLCDDCKVKQSQDTGIDLVRREQ